jgi:toxin ParE1/3/4
VSKPRGFVLDISPRARLDVAEILSYSMERFGDLAETRYDALLKQALRDIAADPARLGSKKRPELGPDFLTYHLASSRANVAGQKVRTPRHFVVYRQRDAATIEIVRILHDNRDLARHISTVSRGE